LTRVNIGEIEKRDAVMNGQPHLTPQQRIRLAQSLRRQANQPGVPVRKKLEKLRHMSNLMQLNLIEARAIRRSSTAVQLGERGEIFGEVLAEDGYSSPVPA
jgi:hypothetical protein